MFSAAKLAALSAVLVLIGAGCAPAAPANDLSAAPSAMTGNEKPAQEEGMKKEPGAAQEPENGEMMVPKEDVAIKQEGGAMMKSDLKPYYAAYSPEQPAKALAEGRAVVYYFWASWCPICQAEEPKIKSWIEQSDLPVAGFRVNYDTETSLKTTYKIPYQHTIVFLNAKGLETGRLSGPVGQADFLAALKAATR